MKEVGPVRPTVGADPSHCATRLTSGTTGEPLTLFRTIPESVWPARISSSVGSVWTRLTTWTMANRFCGDRGSPPRSAHRQAVSLAESADERADQAETAALRSKASRLWRVVERFQVIPWSHPRGPYSSALRRLALQASRSVYRSLPLPAKHRRRLKDIAFRLGAPLFRGTASYLAWRDARVMPAQAALPVPLHRLTLPSASNPHEEAYRASLESATSKSLGDYVPLDESGGSPPDSGVRIIAFYLPQFHPIPVNDAAMGAGLHGVGERLEGCTAVSRALSAAPAGRAGVLRSASARGPDAARWSSPSFMGSMDSASISSGLEAGVSWTDRWSSFMRTRASILPYLPLLGKRELDAQVGRSGAGCLARTDPLAGR